MNVLAIGAHYDDVELGCAGTLRKHVINGDSVYIFVATKSGYNNPLGKVIRDNVVARREGQRAASILGATLISGEFDTLSLEFSDEINSELIKIINDKGINLIYSHSQEDVHHDHISLAKATLHCSRHVPRLLLYHSNWYQGDKVFSPNFYVDISETWSVKEEAIKAHESEFERAGEKWLKFFRNEAENNGLKCGVGLAEAFQVVKWLW